MNEWEKLTIYIDESDLWHGKPLSTALVEEARKQGLAGATVIRGIEGFGVRQHRQIHTARIMELADLPIVVTIIDRAETIAQFLPTVQAMVAVGLITQETIKTILPQ
ncbi:MAG: DUF190 domain-containing protein [Synechococcales cyanobacterium M58_A2018_015]|nr:DUF190 domain-containing protein [Synechococcales cyanobacterium M58_A2018_015]